MINRPASRRDFLQKAGLGGLALTQLLHQSALAEMLGKEEPRSVVQPLLPRVPQLPPRAKSVIFLFMEGGPSHIDLFDPKPKLNELAGQRLPESFGKIVTAMGESASPLLGCNRSWKQHGHSGIWLSDWLPHLAGCVDDLAVIRSCTGDGINHSSGVCQMNTGSILAGRPSLGAWTSYGLGTENQNLPGFVVMQDSATTVVNGPRNWGSGFMPAVYQGTRIEGGSDPIANLIPPGEPDAERQRAKLDLLMSLNRAHAGTRIQSELDARIASYELAFRMQSEAPEAVDLSKETEATKELYGLDDKETARFGGMCLLSRRLVERGVRFVQLYHGAGSKWILTPSSTTIIPSFANRWINRSPACLKISKRAAFSIQHWSSGVANLERTPMSEKGDGRDHNPTGFTMWMAGGGVKGGQTIGGTDELGLRAIDKPLHVHDLHATILWLMGLDNMGLVYKYKGRPERPTLNEGEPYRKIIG